MEDKSKISDGYHTFEELYQHRVALFLIILKQNKDIAFKTLRNKEGEEWMGWGIAGMETNFGQITYHIPIKDYKKLGVKEINKNSKYDGHNASDTLNRLSQFLDSI